MKTETPPKQTMDTKAAKDAAERIARLMADPHPGLITWNLFLATACTNLDKALGIERDDDKTHNSEVNRPKP